MPVYKHSFFCGATSAGKTALACCIAAAWMRKGGKVIVLYPLRDSNPFPCTKYFRTREGFYQEAVKEENNGCLLIVDESGIEIGRSRNELMELPLQFRHDKKQCLFLVQSPTQVPNDLRSSCEIIVTFALKKSHAALLAEEFLLPDLIHAENLKRFEYLHGERFGKVRKGFVMDDLKRAGLWRPGS